MSDTARTSTGEDSKEQETVLEVTPNIPANLIAVYGPSDGRPVIFSRNSLASYNSNGLDKHVIDDVQ